MRIQVEYLKYFEEFGLEDFEVKEFNTLKDANNFFNTNEKATKLIVDSKIIARK